MPESTRRQEDDAEHVEAEARLFAKYLVGADPSAELSERYQRAHATLLPEPHPPIDQAVVSFVRRHPATLPLLDGAMALLRPTGLLRGKLVTMAAILETTPELADHYAPPTPGIIGALARMAVVGVRTSLQTIAGLLLYAVFIRPRIAPS